jgi:hypothetical protein
VWEGGVRDPSITGFGSIKPNRGSWTLKGKPLPFLPKVVTEETKRRIQLEGSVDTIEFYRPALTDSAAVERARIPVEKITAPVLLISSTADRMYPAAAMARQVCATMRNHGRSCESIEYDDAGHPILEPWLPPGYGVYRASPGRWDRAGLGGSAVGSALAAADSWPRIRRFFDEHLRGIADSAGPVSKER